MSELVNHSAGNTNGGKVFVTAQMLQDRLAGSAGGQLELAGNEFLTPAARDVVARKSISVHRAPTAVQGGRNTPAVSSGPQQAMTRLAASAAMPSDRPTVGPVGLVLDRPDGGVAALLDALRYDGAMFFDCNKNACWADDLDVLAGAMAGGDLAAGVAIMPYAADAMVVAGKITGLRPVQGASARAVAAGVRHFDANVLVVGYKTATFGEMRAMIRTFTAARTGSGAPDIMAAIAKHEGR